MYGSILALHRQLGTPVPNESSITAPPSVNRDHVIINIRELAIQETVRSLARQMGIEKHDKIKVRISSNPFKLNLSATKLFAMRLVCIPPLFLVKPEDIPEQFRIVNSNDPRLEDDRVMQEFSDWVCERFELKRHTISPADKHAVRFILRHMEDSELSQKSIKFILGHELGHIHFNHSMKMLPLLLGMAASVGIATTIVATALASTLASLLAIPSLVLHITFLFVIVCIVGRVVLPVFKMISSRYFEAQADRFSIQHFPDCAEGGVHFFQQILHLRRDLRNDSKFSFLKKCKIKLLTTKSGDNYLEILSHGRTTSRIENIRRYALQSQFSRAA